jgi:lipopolysaccharide transport system permease protein
MVGIVDGFRGAVLGGTPTNFYTLGLSALISILLLPIAYLYFKRVEATIADVI